LFHQPRGSPQKVLPRALSLVPTPGLFSNRHVSAVTSVLGQLLDDGGQIDPDLLALHVAVVIEFDDMQ
jgi:hypothetical protein